MTIKKLLKSILTSIVFFISPLFLSAQLCVGSLGDPIVNITFGSGTNPGAPLSAAATNYIFSSSDCPIDGQYTVRNNSSSCFSSTWHTVTNDHTGNSNGYFMLVNASQQPSTFYLDSVEGLCANTTYEFASWILNILKPTSCNGNSSLPNLTFRIELLDGTILQSFNTGNISTTPTPVWKQYGAFFTTPSGVTKVVLRIVNNAIGGCGNDLALDDITFRPCGPTLLPAVNGTSINIKNICVGDTSMVTLSCTVSPGFSNPFYQWQKSTDSVLWNDIPGANSINYSTNFNGTTASTVFFRLTVAEIFNAVIPACRIVSTPITIQINESPIAVAFNNGPVCIGSNITLTATGGNTYTWVGPNSFLSQNAVIVINNIQQINAGTYKVEVTNSKGCKNVDSTVLIITPSPKASLLFADTSICAGNSIQLFASGGIDYLWFPNINVTGANTGNPVVTPSDTTLYKVIVFNSNSCKDSAVVKVNVLKIPMVNAGPDIILIEGQSVKLKGSVSVSNYSIIWSPNTFMDNPSILEPTINPKENITYTLTAISNNGCGNYADSINIKVLKKINIPNAFSPNGDGINDTWLIPALDAYKNHEVRIFDRYGQLIFTSQNFKSWNGNNGGKSFPMGTYYYQLIIKDEPPINGWLLLSK